MLDGEPCGIIPIIRMILAPFSFARARAEPSSVMTSYYSDRYSSPRPVQLESGYLKHLQFYNNRVCTLEWFLFFIVYVQALVFFFFFFPSNAGSDPLGNEDSVDNRCRGLPSLLLPLSRPWRLSLLLLSLLCTWVTRSRSIMPPIRIHRGWWFFSFFFFPPKELTGGYSIVFSHRFLPAIW